MKKMDPQRKYVIALTILVVASFILLTLSENLAKL